MRIPYAIGQRGAVAAAHPLAVEAGLAMLRAGGNAMDAAVATAFALTVVDPGNASLGGRGSLVAYLAEGVEGPRLFSLDFNTVCPGTAGPDTFEVVPTREGEWWSVRDFANTIGHRAVSVPTTAAGLCAAARYGRLPLAALVAPAVEIARSGYPVTVPLEMQLASARDRVLRNPATRTIYAPAGRTLRRGETLANPDLARVLHQLGEVGSGLIYGPQGDVSRALTSDMAASGGLIGEADLATYQTKEYDAVTISYRGHEVAATRLSTGGPTVLAALQILEGFDLGAEDPYDPAVVHLVIEALKLAWAEWSTYAVQLDYWQGGCLGVTYNQAAG